MNIVITGAAGYIGGQIALQLKDAGHAITGIDRRPLPTHLTGIMDFVQADFDCNESFKKLLDVRPDAVVHCAGSSLVGPSMKTPSDYYHNNMARTMHLLDFVLAAMPQTRIIFSSSAAVYGEPVMANCHEVDPKEPISPYGESKLMIDWMLEAYRRAYGLDYVSFRYFNACGADAQKRHGQEPGATHIIARVLECLRDDAEFTLNGTNYPTPDGTCIRDYVHVEDIARAHALALDRAVPAGVYNLGSGTGISNREIIAAAERITGKELKIISGKQRDGDPPLLTASAGKFNSVADQWQQHDLDAMIGHAWAWYVR
jgi:UDP-glucose 4-epimerase